MENHMSDTKIYLDLSTEIQELLADNEISIADILQQENIDVSDVTEGVMPQKSEDGTRTKDLVPIILAGSAAVTAIAYAISKILNALNPQSNSKKYTFEAGFKDVFFIKFIYEENGVSEDEGND
jgi:hypothetical protein